jgi:hypothetical protein
LAGIVGTLIGTALFDASMITSVEIRKLLNIKSSAIWNENNPSDNDSEVIHFESFLPLIATFIWLGLGGLYGAIFEGKTFGSSLYFALSTMSGASYASEWCV